MECVALVGSAFFHTQCLMTQLLTEIRFQKTALLSFQAAYCLFLDLTHALTRQIEFITYLLKGHLLTAYPEKHFQNVTFTLMELA